MSFSWLIPLMLLASEGPLLTLDEHGKLTATALDTWLVHEGCIPELEWTSAATGEVNPDLIHAEVLQTLLGNLRAGGFNEAGGWRAVNLPHAVKGGVSGGSKDYITWFASEFRLPATLKDRTVGLWVGDVNAALRVFVNGQLIGEQGRDTPNDFWPGRRSVLGYHVPPALLHADKPNTVAIYAHAAHVSTTLQDVYVGDPRGFADHAFWSRDARRLPSIAVTFLLLSFFAYCTLLYATRRTRVDALYFGFGTLGLAIVLFGMWCVQWPFNDVYFLRLTFLGLPLIMFFALCYQRYFSIHYRPGAQRWACFVLGIVMFVTCFLPTHRLMPLFVLGATGAVATLFYCTYIAHLAWRRGLSGAAPLLSGMGILTLCCGVQWMRFLQGAQEASGPLSLGAFGLVMATFIAVVRRVGTLNESVNAYAQDLEERHEAHQKIVAEIAKIAGEVDAVSRGVLMSVSEGQRGSLGQSSAVAETKAAMQSLLGSGRNIMQAAQEVLHGAELTQRNNDQVSERLGDLSRHSQRIAEILNVIREVANKSDLLALNAALEGVRAGHLGRGFTLVATQMQQLAETIMRAVADIRELTVDIREASLSTESSNNEATRLATDTTKSARQISVFIAEQQAGTEQVSRAMEDIAEVATDSAKHSDLTLHHMQELIRNAERLRTMVSELEPDAMRGA